MRFTILLSLSWIPVMLGALYEPAGNQVLLGMWLDTAFGYSDTPSLMNKRLGYNVPVYQIAQDIPLIKYNYTTGAGGAAPESLIELSGTDAAVFLTIYPVAGFQYVQAADITQLGQQILNYQADLNRTVFLRYAPEMQGLWNVNYGQRPTEFVASWINMYNGIKAIAPATIFVWAPNESQGYPYGQSFAANAATGYPGANLADQAALDTNKDGVFNAADDAFSPYYPGDPYVDWIGLSLYYKGPNGNDVNVAQPANYCGNSIDGINPDDGVTPITPWYSTYCANKPTKACMFSESGAAYHVNVPGGLTAAALHQGWIADCVTSTTFLDAHPRLKLIMNFEYEKYETANDGTQDLRDYRLTNDTAVLTEFQADLLSINRYSWANSRAKPTSISTPGAPQATPVIVVTNSNGQIVTETQTSTLQAITNTLRERPTGFPALFGSTSDGNLLKTEIIEVGIMVLAGVAGSLAVMKMM